MARPNLGERPRLRYVSRRDMQRPRTSSTPTGGALLAAAILAVLTAGCETFTPSTCDTSRAGNPAQLFTGGTVEDGVYMSSSWDGPLLWFPGGMYYCLQHPLPAAPRWALSYIAFSETGAGGGDGLAQAAGNEALIVGMAYGAPDGGADADGGTDRCPSSEGTMAIEVTNSSCSDTWLLVVAGSGAPSASP
jgi:hypothetical protein